MAKPKMHPKCKAAALPEGFVRHDGGKCPFPPRAKLRMAILTAEHGVLVTQPQHARMHVWEHGAHEDGIGAVVGYEPPITGE